MRVILILTITIGLCFSNTNPFRFKLCTEKPWTVQRVTEGQPSRGCVVTFNQKITDSVIAKQVDSNPILRRYLVYVPDHDSATSLPIVFVFPGKGVNAEIMAYTETHTRFETLADRDQFIVVYGNGIPVPAEAWEGAPIPLGGFLQGCLMDHDSEGIDVSYVRLIVEQLESQFKIDRKRIYATGESAGGGMAFQLAMEAPDLIAAIAPVVPLPFQPSGIWQHYCQLKPGFERVSILMLAATHDPFIAYKAGSSRYYPGARYPGMEETRDAWLNSMGPYSPPRIDTLPDRVQGDSYTKETQLMSSFIVRSCYAQGKNGQEFCFLKAVGMGHRWPSPIQTPSRLWDMFGKTNQDMDFADVAWDFFKKHSL